MGKDEKGQDMDRNQAEARIKELKQELEYHIERYYNQDNPEISDYEYDMKMQELKKLEEDFPERGYGKTRGRVVGAPQCSHAESSGCVFQRGSGNIRGGDETAAGRAGICGRKKN